jgi:hypothetical protein
MRYKPMVNKIKAWLEDEVRTNNKSTYDDYDHEVVDDDSDVYLCRGRAECAEGLLNEIKKWENE